MKEMQIDCFYRLFIKQPTVMLQLVEYHAHFPKSLSYAMGAFAPSKIGFHKLLCCRFFATQKRRQAAYRYLKLVLSASDSHHRSIYILAEFWICNTSGWVGAF